MKNTILKRCAVFVLVFALISSVLALGAGAAELAVKTASANSGIKISVNGSQFFPCDANGEPVDVFLIDGTNYLPVRAVSSLFSVGIMWDDANKVVYLGTHDGKALPVSSAKAKQNAVPAYDSASLNIYTGVGIYYNDELFTPTDVNGNPVEPFLCNGTTYLPVRAISALFGAKIDWDGEAKTVRLTGVPDPVSSDGLIAEAKTLAKQYADAGEAFKECYAYYLLVDETARSVLETFFTENNAGGGGADVAMTLLIIQAEYNNFKTAYETRVTSILSALDEAKALSDAISEASSDDSYNETELSVIKAKFDYLKSNYPAFMEDVQACAPDKLKEYVDKNFTTIKNHKNLTGLGN